MANAQPPAGDPLRSPPPPAAPGAPGGSDPDVPDPGASPGLEPPGPGAPPGPGPGAPPASRGPRPEPPPPSDPPGPELPPDPPPAAPGAPGSGYTPRRSRASGRCPADPPHPNCRGCGTDQRSRGANPRASGGNPRASTPSLEAFLEDCLALVRKHGADYTGPDWPGPLPRSPGDHRHFLGALRAAVKRPWSDVARFPPREFSEAISAVWKALYREWPKPGGQQDAGEACRGGDGTGSAQEVPAGRPEDPLQRITPASLAGTLMFYSRSHGHDHPGPWPWEELGEAMRSCGLTWPQLSEGGKPRMLAEAPRLIEAMRAVRGRQGAAA